MPNNNFLQDTLTQKVTSGEFHPHGKKDTLSEALGNEEHRGRVRGLGKGYTWGNYWGTSATRGTMPISAFEQYKQQMNESMQMLPDKLSIPIAGELVVMLMYLLHLLHPGISMWSLW